MVVATVTEMVVDLAVAKMGGGGGGGGSVDDGGV